EAGAIGAGVSGLTQAIPASLRTKLNDTMQRVVTWAEEHGIPTSFGQRTGSQQLQRVEQGLENIPGAAGRTQEFFEGQERAIGQAGQDLAQQISPGATTTPLEAGQAVRTKLGQIVA